jgi:hypothetical protein
LTNCGASSAGAAANREPFAALLVYLATMANCCSQLVSDNHYETSELEAIKARDVHRSAPTPWRLGLRRLDLRPRLASLCTDPTDA